MSTGDGSVVVVHSDEGSLLIHLNFMTPDLARLPLQPPGKNDPGSTGPEG